jgi:hypothetical protein
MAQVLLRAELRIAGGRIPPRLLLVVDGSEIPLRPLAAPPAEVYLGEFHLVMPVSTLELRAGGGPLVARDLELVLEIEAGPPLRLRFSALDLPPGATAKLWSYPPAAMEV